MAQPASEPAAEWAVRYSRYVQESAARAARTAELNTRLVKRIASGDLAPATLERQYAAFLAANGRSYGDDIAETGLRFLTGLVQAGTTYSRELVERIAPGELDTERREPPPLEPGEWSTAFQRLTDFAMAENTAVAALLRALMEKVASGAISPDGMHSASAEFHGEQVPQTVDELVRLFFDLMTRLDEAHADFGHRYLESVLELAGEAEPGEVGLELTGASGETVSARLAVSNNEPEPATLRAVMTDVRRTDGVGPAFDPDLTIRPARFTLAAGAEEVVTVTVRLAAETFEPGGPEYAGLLHVLSPGRTVLAVPVRIRAAVAVDLDEVGEVGEVGEP
jgi:hypothetical protein